MHRLWALGLLRRRRTPACSSSIVAAKELSSSSGPGSFLITWARHFAAEHRKKKPRRLYGQPIPRPTGQPQGKRETQRRKRPSFSLQAARKIIADWPKISIRLGLTEPPEDEEEEEVEWQSRNERKRQAMRALPMAKLLITFSKRQIQDAVKFAFLPNNTLESVILAQRLKVEGMHQPKGRQIKYVAGLIRKSDPDLVEFVFYSLRDGHNEKLRKVIASLTTSERKKQVQRTAEDWVYGILSGDKSITNEVFALPYDYLDKSRLKEAIRNVKVQVSRKHYENNPLQGFMHGDLHRARKTLTKILEGAADCVLRAREELAEDDAALLEEHGASQAEAFLSQTDAQVIDVEETGSQAAEATVMVERAAQREPVEEAQYQELEPEAAAHDRARNMKRNEARDDLSDSDEEEEENR